MESPRHTCLKLVISEPDNGTESEPILVKGTWYPTRFDLSITNGLQAWTCHATEEEVKERASQWDQPVSEYIDLAEKYLGFEQPGSVYGLSDAGNGFRRENKEYKDFKDKDVSEIYIRYRQLFGDSYDGDKYAITPRKLCKMGSNLFDDSELEDQRDATLADEESSGSSDEADEVHVTSSVKASCTTSGGKRKSSSGPRRGMKKKVSTRELSFSVDQATSAAKEVAAKINTMMNSNENVGVACVKELFAAGLLERRTPLYFFVCTVLAQKRYQDTLSVFQDTHEKFEWILWLFNQCSKPFRFV